MPYHLPNQANSSRIRPSDLTLNRARSMMPRPQQSQVGKKRMRLTDAEKLELGYRYFVVKPKISQADLCAWAKREFNLQEEPTQSTISRALQKYPVLKEAPENKLKAFNSRGAKFPLLEQKLVGFVKQMEDSSFAINSHSLKAEAERLCMADPLLLDGEPMPAFSNGWFDRFMKRNMLKCRLMNGEAGSVDINHPDLVAQVADIKTTIATYERRNVFNFDETGLFYRQAPQKTISSRDVAGVKVDKTRITIGLMCNADGSSKEEPVIIAKAEKPVCFNGKSGIILLILA